MFPLIPLRESSDLNVPDPLADAFSPPVQGTVTSAPFLSNSLGKPLHPCPPFESCFSSCGLISSFAYGIGSDARMP